MNEQQYQEFCEKFGKDFADKYKAELGAAEKRINDANAERFKGLMTVDTFEKFKTEELGKLNEKLAGIATLEESVKEIGEKLKANLEISNRSNRKSIADFIEDQGPAIRKMREEGTGCIVITGKELKDAGVTGIGGSIDDMTTPPGSPYTPGLAGTSLQIFDILRNQNYILGAVDVGRTNQARLAWANEISLTGSPELVAEGAEKPLIEHKFKVETSTAKKIAGYVKITEEFDDDLPGFGTAVRRMLNQDVLRTFDDKIQLDVIAAAVGYTLGGFSVDDPNYWDALRFMYAQVKISNFQPNSIGIYPGTGAVLDTTKNTEGTYLLPGFGPDFRRLITEANKVDAGKAFVGDLKQYKVDIYKDFSLRIGWVNDDLIRNQFVVLGEIRYHSYISDARKAGIVYADLDSVVATLDDAPASS